MSANSKIEWTTHTFNPWWGCTKVSPGCDNCYAERDAKRFGTKWGPGAPRRYMGDAYWNEPRKWNARAERAWYAWRSGSVAGGCGGDELVKLGFHQPERPRVFCASMSDVFDNEVLDAHRRRLWDLIRDTPYLDWLLLTKRIGNVPKMLPVDWDTWGSKNAWLGISVVNQEEADRDIPKLLAVPARVRFLSCEPLLGPIDLIRARAFKMATSVFGAVTNTGWHQTGVNWVIAGGESGPGARPMHPDWARSLRDQCVAAGVAYFFKQWGEWLPALCDGAVDNPKGQHWNCDDEPIRVGKRAAGRLLDGRTWDELPKRSTPSRSITAPSAASALQ